MIYYKKGARIYIEALPILSLGVFGGIFAGSFLGVVRSSLTTQFIFVLPAFLASRGHIYGSLSARLSSSLHRGEITPFNIDSTLLSSVIATIFNSLSVSIFIALSSWLILNFLGFTSSLSILISTLFIGGFLSDIFLSFLIVFILFSGHNRGIDPDNLTAVALTIGDLFGAVFLYVGIIISGVIF